MTERGMNYMIEYVDELKGIIGDKIGLALDCGPGMMPQDAMKFAKAMEPYNLMWLEDMKYRLLFAIHLRPFVPRF